MNSHKKLDSKNLDIIDSVGGDYAPKLKSRRSSQALSKSSRKGQRIQNKSNPRSLRSQNKENSQLSFYSNKDAEMQVTQLTRSHETSEANIILNNEIKIIQQQHYLQKQINKSHESKILVDQATGVGNRGRKVSHHSYKPVQDDGSQERIEEGTSTPGPFQNQALKESVCNDSSNNIKLSCSMQPTQEIYSGRPTQEVYSGRMVDHIDTDNINSTLMTQQQMLNKNIKNKLIGETQIPNINVIFKSVQQRQNAQNTPPKIPDPRNQELQTQYLKRIISFDKHFSNKSSINRNISSLSNFRDGRSQNTGFSRISKKINQKISPTWTQTKSPNNQTPVGSLSKHLQIQNRVYENMMKNAGLKTFVNAIDQGNHSNIFNTRISQKNLQIQNQQNLMVTGNKCRPQTGQDVNFTSTAIQNRPASQQYFNTRFKRRCKNVTHKKSEAPIEGQLDTFDQEVIHATQTVQDKTKNTLASPLQLMEIKIQTSKSPKTDYIESSQQHIDTNPYIYQVRERDINNSKQASMQHNTPKHGPGPNDPQIDVNQSSNIPLSANIPNQSSRNQLGIEATSMLPTFDKRESDPNSAGLKDGRRMPIVLKQDEKQVSLPGQDESDMESPSPLKMKRKQKSTDKMRMSQGKQIDTLGQSQAFSRSGNANQGSIAVSRSGCGYGQLGFANPINQRISTGVKKSQNTGGEQMPIKIFDIQGLESAGGQTLNKTLQSRDSREKRVKTFKHRFGGHQRNSAIIQNSPKNIFAQSNHVNQVSNQQSLSGAIHPCSLERISAMGQHDKQKLIRFRETCSSKNLNRSSHSGGLSQSQVESLTMIKKGETSMGKTYTNKNSQSMINPNDSMKNTINEKPSTQSEQVTSQQGSEQGQDEVIYLESEFKQSDKFWAYQKIGHKYSQQVNILKNRQKLSQYKKQIFNQRKNSNSETRISKNRWLNNLSINRRNQDLIQQNEYNQLYCSAQSPVNNQNQLLLSHLSQTYQGNQNQDEKSVGGQIIVIKNKVFAQVPNVGEWDDLSGTTRNIGISQISQSGQDVTMRINGNQCSIPQPSIPNSNYNYFQLSPCGNNIIFNDPTVQLSAGRNSTDRGVDREKSQIGNTNLKFNTGPCSIGRNSPNSNRTGMNRQIYQGIIPATNESSGLTTQLMSIQANQKRNQTQRVSQPAIVNISAEATVATAQGAYHNIHLGEYYKQQLAMRAKLFQETLSGRGKLNQDRNYTTKELSLQNTQSRNNSIQSMSDYNQKHNREIHRLNVLNMQPPELIITTQNTEVGTNKSKEHLLSQQTFQLQQDKTATSVAKLNSIAQQSNKAKINETPTVKKDIPQSKSGDEDTSTKKVDRKTTTEEVGAESTQIIHLQGVSEGSRSILKAESIQLSGCKSKEKSNNVYGASKSLNNIRTKPPPTPGDERQATQLSLYNKRKEQQETRKQNQSPLSNQVNFDQLNHIVSQKAASAVDQKEEKLQSSHQMSKQSYPIKAIFNKSKQQSPPRVVSVNSTENVKQVKIIDNSPMPTPLANLTNQFYTYQQVIDQGYNDPILIRNMDGTNLKENEHARIMFIDRRGINSQQAQRPRPISLLQYNTAHSNYNYQKQNHQKQVMTMNDKANWLEIRGANLNDQKVLNNMQFYKPASPKYNDNKHQRIQSSCFSQQQPTRNNNIDQHGNRGLNQYNITSYGYGVESASFISDQQMNESIGNIPNQIVEQPNEYDDASNNTSVQCMFGAMSDSNNNKSFHRFDAMNSGANNLKQRLINITNQNHIQFQNQAKIENIMIKNVPSILQKQNISNINQTGLTEQALGKINILLGMNKSRSKLTQSQMSSVISSRDQRRPKTQEQKMRQTHLKLQANRTTNQNTSSLTSNNDNPNDLMGEQRTFSETTKPHQMSEEGFAGIRFGSFDEYNLNDFIQPMQQGAMPSYQVNQVGTMRKKFRNTSQDYRLMQRENTNPRDRHNAEKQQKVKIQKIINESSGIEKTKPELKSPRSNSNEAMVKMERKSIDKLKAAPLILMNKQMLSMETIGSISHKA